jgi:hypothetical protein
LSPIYRPFPGFCSQKGVDRCHMLHQIETGLVLKQQRVTFSGSVDCIAFILVAITFVTVFIFYFV